jgi:hypothetical protein
MQFHEYVALFYFIYLVSEFSGPFIRSHCRPTNTLLLRKAVRNANAHIAWYKGAQDSLSLGVQRKVCKHRRSGRLVLTRNRPLGAKYSLRRQWLGKAIPRTGRGGL